MTSHPSRLDADELLHLALNAAKTDRHDAAIEYLKRALEIDPKHAKAHYFLAAEHAQIGLYDRAIEEMQTAIALDSTLHTAHFQLGLLQLTSGRVEQARAAWQPLETLGDENSLCLFKKGLEAMANDQFDDCRSFLTKGIALNQVNQDLNVDMQRVLDALPTAASGEPAKIAQPGHMFLSAYTGDGKQD